MQLSAWVSILKKASLPSSDLCVSSNFSALSPTDATRTMTTHTHNQWHAKTFTKRMTSSWTCWIASCATTWPNTSSPMRSATRETPSCPFLPTKRRTAHSSLATTTGSATWRAMCPTISKSRLAPCSLDLLRQLSKPQTTSDLICYKSSNPLL